MRIRISEIINEHIPKGKTGYYSANITYTANGETKTNKVLSWANPATYKNLTDGSLKAGDTAEVTITKNDKGYFQWAAIVKVDGEASPAAASSQNGNPPPARANWETSDERRAKQLYIIKQSSIGHALECLKATAPEGKWGVGDVIETAQIFVDYVYSNEDMDTGNAVNPDISA